MRQRCEYALPLKIFKMAGAWGVGSGEEEMRKKYISILLLVMLLALSILAIPAIADAGNFSGSTDYGGSSDWGGGYDYDYDWGSSGTGSGAIYTGTGGSGGNSVMSVVVFVIVVLLVLALAKRNGGSKGGVPAPAPKASGYSDLRPIEELRALDENFSEAALREKISNLYVQMQNAWQDKNFEPMRPHMTDALYTQFDRQLAELVRANATNYVERIAVLGVELKGWRQDAVNDSIVAIVNTRIIDYTLDDNTGKLLSGSKTAEKFMTYEWTLIRSKGMQTPAPSGEGRECTVSIRCPSCGAPLEINHSAKCSYCDCVVNARDYDWAISSVKGLAQRTGN